MSGVQHLWRTAPAWRTALIIAICASALTLAYPPSFTSLRAGSTGSALPPSAYVSPSSGATPPPEPEPTSSAVKYGDVLEREISFNGRAIPLPAGTWRVVASLPGADTNHVTIDVKALANESEGKLRGLVLLVGNDEKTPSRTGFRADANCERSDVIFTKLVRNDDFGDQRCYYVDLLITDAKESSSQQQNTLLRAAFGDLDERRVTVPSTMLGAMFRYASHERLLIAKFFFNPEVEGITPSAKVAWLDNDWNKYNLARNLDKSRYVQRLEAWAAKWDTVLQSVWTGQTSTAVTEIDRVLPKSPLRP